MTIRNPRAAYTALLPMNVMGDGNCCLHSCSVSLWGVQDRANATGLGTVRSSMHRLMTQQRHLFFRRWQQQEQKWDAEDARLAGMETIEREDEEWERDFQDILDRSGRDTAHLVQIHIYVLAHVLRRPIIVYSDAWQEVGAMESPCRMRGIYIYIYIYIYNYYSHYYILFIIVEKRKR